MKGEPIKLTMNVNVSEIVMREYSEYVVCICKTGTHLQVMELHGLVKQVDNV